MGLAIDGRGTCNDRKMKVRIINLRNLSLQIKSQTFEKIVLMISPFIIECI
jgi:hypothetical protein